MKILLINDFFEKVGGAEQVLHSTMQILEEQGHQVRLYAPTTPRSIASSLFSFRHYRAVKRLVREFRPDVVHAHGVFRNVSPSVLLAAKSLGAPLVMTLHDFHLVCPKTSLVNNRRASCGYGYGWRCLMLDCYPRTRFSRLYQWSKMAKLTLHRALFRLSVDQFVPPSTSLAHWTRTNFGSPNVTLLPYLLMSEHTPSPQPPPTTDLLFIGRLSEQKGVDVLIRAVALARRTLPGVQLRIVGSGDYEPVLRELVRELGVEAQVQFAGPAANEEVMREYDRAYCVVIPSKYVENLSVVGLEATAKGKAVIATRIGGLPDIVDHGRNGFLVEPGDPEDLAGRIVEILSHPELLPAMGAHARDKFARTFSKSAYYGTLMGVYERMVHEARRHP